MNRRTLNSVASITVLLVPALLNFTQSAEAQSSACRPPDAISDQTTSLLKNYVTSTDSFTVRIRNSLGIAGTPTNKIAYSTDSRTCTSAVTALNNRFNTPGRARKVYVWNVGTNNAVWDPADQLPGGYRSILLFTSKWAFKSAWAPN